MVRARMRSVTAEVGTGVSRLSSRAIFACARHRFVVAGLALAIVAGAGAPALAEHTGAPLEIVLIALLALAFVGLGRFLGRRIDALTESSLEDPMTRVGNRRHWEGMLLEEIERARSSRMPLSILLLDVDNLKKLNDGHGHALGDRALALVGQVLLETCRSRDVPARLGGDEFAVLLPRTRASEARVVAERIRASLAKRRARSGAPLDALLTVSIGIADLDGVHGQTDALFEWADKALYAAKQAGRDRIEVMQAPCVSGVICLDEHRKAKKNQGVATVRV